MAAVKLARIGDGVYRVEHGDRQDTVYLAGAPGSEWAFWNGRVFHRAAEKKMIGDSPRPPSRGAHVPQALTPPMPATVIKVLVSPGAAVRKGDTLVLLEAMKMELPVRAPADATVKAVNCREGDLVQPEMTIVELE